LAVAASTWTTDEVRDHAAYQTGALQAIVASEGGRLAHGDAPNAVETARTVRQALESAGVTVTALRMSRTSSSR
jgi:lactam utilization protein B